MTNNFQWEAGFDRNFLLKKIADYRTVTGSKCSFKINYRYWLPVLNSAIRADKIVGSLKARCIERAVYDPMLTLTNADSFLDRCQQAFDTITKAKKNKYVVLFDLTYTGPKLFSRIQDGACRIYWQPKESNRFLAKALGARDELSHILDARKVPRHVDGLTALLVHTEAVDVPDAYELAANAVDRLRGILNLIVNAQRGANPFAGLGLSTPHALNKLRLGPYRTVHHPDGTLAAKQFWYEARWSHDEYTVKFSGAPEATRARIRKWWKKSQNNPLQSHITDGLLRYCRALDQHNTDAALLGIWGALENLTGTTEKNTYDVSVNRVVSLFKNENEARQVAQHVRRRRNATVHTAQSPDSDEVETITWQAEQLVSKLLFFYIRMGSHFRNQRELVEFLSLPLDKGVLVRRQMVIRQFIKYRS